MPAWAYLNIGGFTLSLLAVALLGFWIGYKTGYSTGRAVERDEWIEASHAQKQRERANLGLGRNRRWLRK